MGSRGRSVVAAIIASCLVAASFLAAPSAQAQRGCRGLRATKVGSGASDTLRGTAGRDVIVGLGGDDVLLGFEGHDVLCGGPGNDLLIGAAGNDTLLGDGGFDGLLPYLGRDKVVGGVGADAVLFWWASGVSANLGRRVTRGEGPDRLKGIEDLVGSPAPDVLKGDGGVNIITGLGGGDAIKGGGGDDLLAGWSGSNRIDGGPGRDVATYVKEPRGVVASLKSGRAEHLDRRYGCRCDWNTDFLRRIEDLEGSGKDPDRLTGDAGANRFYGGSDRGDTFVMGGGKDRLVDLGASTVSSGGAGKDVIVTPKSDASGDAGNDILDARHGYGGGGNDKIWAGYGYGGDGNDLIVGNGEGGEGQDEFAFGGKYFGGPGVDIMHGSRKGTYFGHLPGSDEVPTTADADIASYGMAKRAVRVDLENLSAEPKEGGAQDTFAYPMTVFGSRFDDVLIGHAGVDTLIGWKGNDELTGGAGDDLLRGSKGDDTADGGLGLDRCPQVETRTFCEDELDELPISPPNMMSARPETSSIAASAAAAFGRSPDLWENEVGAMAPRSLLSAKG